MERRRRPPQGTARDDLAQRARTARRRAHPTALAAWTGESFVWATKAEAAKTRHLETDGAVSLAVDLDTLHLVAEGDASRLTDRSDLERASSAVLVFPTADQVEAMRFHSDDHL